MRFIKRFHWQWPWMNPNLDFKVIIFFNFLIEMAKRIFQIFVTFWQPHHSSFCVWNIMAKFWLFFCTQVQGRIQARSIFCTNIILHRRELFYKFADITVMFLSQDSLYCFAMHLMRQQNAICCPNDDDQWSAGGVHPSASPSQLHSMQNRLLLWTISLTLEPADWFCKNWLETKWWVDEMMIIWYCHTISICKDSFFSLRKCFFSLMT